MEMPESDKKSFENEAKKIHPFLSTLLIIHSLYKRRQGTSIVKLKHTVKKEDTITWE